MSLPGDDDSVSRLEFLRSAEEKAIGELRRHASRVRLPAGATICHEGDRCEQLPLVLSGTARVYKNSEAGREITLYYLGEGDGCILTASCILSSLDFPATAVTVSEVEALVVPAAAFHRWMGEYEAWRSYVCGLLARRLGGVVALVEEVAFRRLDTRLAEFLVRRAGDLGSDALSTTHEAIASELGSSREVISRLLQDFQRSGAIELGRGRIRILDARELRRKETPA